MRRWRYRRVTSESLPVAQRPGDAEVERHCLTHVMAHGASTVWHAVLDLTGMRGATHPRSLA